MKRVYFIFLFFIVGTSFSNAQNTSPLQIDQIMQGEDFVGYLPENITWSDDSKEVYFSWNPDADTLRSTYKVNVHSKDISKLSVEALKNQTNRGDYNGDDTKKVYASNGDIFLEDTKTFKIKQITNTLNRESNPVFSGNDQAVIYRMDNNLYTWSMADGSTKQLTDFRTGNKKEDKETAQEKWLENDQLEEFDILRKRKGEQDAREYRNALIEPKRPKPIYLNGKRLSYVVASPDLNYVIYRLYKDAKDKNTDVPDYVTQSGYTKDKIARPKVGGPQNQYESWIYDTKRDTIYRIKTDHLKGIYKKPEFLKDYAEDTSTYNESYDDPKPVIIGSPIFSDDNKAVFSIRSQDHKDRWIALLDLNNGDLKDIDHQHDEAWIGGPGISGYEINQTLGWIDNDHIYFQSEKTGFSHLYTADVNSGKIKALTEGDFEILDVQLSKDKKTFFITSNKPGPFEHQFYYLPVNGGKMTKITNVKGGFEVSVSPDEKMLALRYSYINKPWELYLMPNKPGAKMEQITHSTTTQFKSYPWRENKIVKFKASDGVMVPATLYEPSPDKKNGAAIIFVHGAGYLQNVHHWWSSYFREYMFNNMLADNGYTVLAIDYRASKGYGRDWRTAIYRHMGGRDFEDQVDGAKYLVNEQGIDQDRIGIYGGSYGGFMTLMCLFKAPEVFKSGAALRSVTDWAHYNHGYTSNILNTPVEDPQAYKQSSPIYFADGLEGQLLMLHGVIDTNVHFQDVVRLSQRLIELGKKNWDLAVFPLESHGFVESSSWTDEYRRIFDLFNNTLLEK
ncbi:S9 family peptidase [Gaetbulibacter aestuarii]|uniref:Alpha/beta fold hydrolase n=1 Tax=Gaetbulibacter aestuarii TaxID=1502358 RepID=A0ABW7MZ90_9FLAO